MMINTDRRIKENFLFLRNLANQKGALLKTKLLYTRGCIQKNHLTDAWKEYKIIYKRNKRLLRGNPDAIRIFYWKKQYDIARELADAYLQEFPQDEKVRNIQIKCYKIQKVSDTQIRRALQETVKYNPKTKKWWLKLARLDIAAGDAPAALQHAKIWVKRNPNSKEGYSFLLPLVVRNSDEQDTYQKALEKLIELEPRRSTDRRKMLGLLKFQNKKYREAEKLLSQSAMYYLKDHEVWYALGMSRLKLNIEGKNKAAFARAYKLAPDSVKYARAYGQFLESDQAIKSHFKLFKLLEQNSPNISEQIKITRSYTLNGSKNAAGQTWKKLVDKDPLFLVSHPEAVVPMISAGYLSLILKNYQNYQNSFEINFALGKKLAEMDQRNEALGYLITAYQLIPSNLEVLLLIARLNGELKKYSQGLDAYVHALALHPRRADIQEKATNLAQQSGDWDNIKKICQVIVLKDPRAHKAHFLMAKAYLMQDNPDMAAVSLTRAIQLQPSNREYKALQDQIP
jgi:cytochrome c-type biogenesis protein CcmH/NrfG